jgi:hypothetical protein
MTVIIYAALRADGAGRSEFNDRRLELRPGVYVAGIPLVDIADSIAVSALTLSRCEPNYISDWHLAPRRQFVFILQGGFEITTGHGETRQFEAGAMFLVEDTTGDGHQTRTIGADACLFATAACANMERPESTQP